MTEHKFRVGQLVRMNRGDDTKETNLYQVVHMLAATPEGDSQYRLRGIYEWHERIAVDSQISRAVQVNLGSAATAGLA